ncbi:MAG: hypothetical protein OXG97_08865 [Candidatus Poribacteria bacterium]|nr:hypothetical protein [Candidatus Poribacteria bacterium]
MYIKILGIAAILVIFFCVGIFFFTRWENQHFVGELPELPKVEDISVPVKQRELKLKEDPTQMPSVTIVEPEILENSSITPEIPDIETERQAFQETDTTEFDLALDPLSLSTVELPEALPESPVEGIDWVKIKVASQDYNAFLESDPDYAYDRLTDRFKEMFGDRPEIATLVENIRRSNEGTLTLDDAIAMTEASLSLLPADETEAIRQLSENLEIFREIKAFQEEGGHVNVEFNISVGGE